MLRIGMIGADNFHALAFSRLANLPPEEGGSGLPARVTMLWGESAQRAAFVANEAHIHTVVDDPARMLGQVDAVMVVLRHGAQHHDAALPFLRAGISTWVDKPFTTDIGQAAALVAAARESGALLAGGSTCKYCPDVLWLRDKYRAMCADGGVISAGLNFPGELDSPYGGLYFYGGHTAEILTTAFGPDIISVKADVTAGNVGHDGIEFHCRQRLGAAGRQDERDSRRPRPQVQGRSVRHGTEVGQEDRIQGKAELVIALDDFHAVQDQVVQPFVRA